MASRVHLTRSSLTRGGSDRECLGSHADPPRPLSVRLSTVRRQHDDAEIRRTIELNANPDRGHLLPAMDRIFCRLTGLTFVLWSGFGAAQPAAEEQSEKPLPTTPEAIQQESGQSIAKQREAVQSIAGLAARAQAERDAVRLNCLKSKLEQMQGLLRISEAADTAIQEFIVQGDLAKAQVELRKTRLASSKTDTLQVEARQCVGVSSVYSGNTSIETIIDDALFEDDPTRSPPFPGPTGPGVPPVASAS